MQTTCKVSSLVFSSLKMGKNSPHSMVIKKIHCLLQTAVGAYWVRSRHLSCGNTWNNFKIIFFREKKVYYNLCLDVLPFPTERHLDRFTLSSQASELTPHQHRLQPTTPPTPNKTDQFLLCHFPPLTFTTPGPPCRRQIWQVTKQYWYYFTSFFKS